MQGERRAISIKSHARENRGRRAVMQSRDDVMIVRDRPRKAICVSDMTGKMARVTGLEPATSGVTGRRSNQLSYTPARVGGG